MRISDWSSDVCSSDLPRPRPQDPVEQEFWKRCQDGNLYFQRCGGCGCFRHLPRYMCAKCGSPEFSWERSSGKGTLFRSEEHTSELQSLMRISYAVFCLKKKKIKIIYKKITRHKIYTDERSYI